MAAEDEIARCPQGRTELKIQCVFCPCTVAGGLVAPDVDRIDAWEYDPGGSNGIDSGVWWSEGLESYEESECVAKVR